MTDSPVTYTPLPPPADWWYQALSPKAKVNIVATDRQRGKTTLALWFALSNAIAGKRVFYYVPLTASVTSTFNRLYDHLRSGGEPHANHWIAHTDIRGYEPEVEFGERGVLVVGDDLHRAGGYDILILDDFDLLAHVPPELKDLQRTAQSILITGTYTAARVVPVIEPAHGAPPVKTNALLTLMAQAAGHADWHVYEVTE